MIILLYIYSLFNVIVSIGPFNFPALYLWELRINIWNSIRPFDVPHTVSEIITCFPFSFSKARRWCSWDCSAVSSPSDNNHHVRFTCLEGPIHLFTFLIFSMNWLHATLRNLREKLELSILLVLILFSSSDHSEKETSHKNQALSPSLKPASRFSSVMTPVFLRKSIVLFKFGWPFFL